jgi:hypothetical protein
MATFDYAKTVDTARRLLGRFGQTIKIEREIGGEQDPVTGIITPGTLKTFSVLGVFENYDVKEIDGTRIQTNDRRLIVDGTVEPLMTDRIVAGGESLGVIVGITPIMPADKAVIYMLQIRV